MKKFILLFLLASNTLSCYSQYFEWCQGLMAVSSSQAASIYPLSIDVDYNGNFLFTADSKPCLLCTHETHMVKKGKPRNWDMSGFSFYLSGNTHKMFGDGAGNSFYYGSINKTMIIGGVSTALHTSTDTLAFIKFDTAGVALWAKTLRIKNAYVDFIGNSYLIDDSNKVTFCDPQGQQQWQRPFYGTTLYADSSYNYYQYNNANLIKFDSSGVIQWQLGVSSNAYYFTRMCTRLFVRTGILYSEINLVDGSVLNTTSYGGAAYDSRGNYYNGSYTSKGDSTGTLWSYSGIFPAIGMDMDDNIYHARNLNTGYGGQAYNLFVPPNVLIINNPAAYGGYSNVLLSYKINPYDTIHNGTITTGNVAAICAGGKLTVPFTYNTYFVQYYDPGFSVELSDSSGSFAQPVVIGTGNHSPIECNIPYFNLQGTNYRVRVVSNTTPKIIGSPCPSPLTAYQPVAAHIEFSNMSLITGQMCFPALMEIVPAGNYTCKWYLDDYQSPSVWTNYGYGPSNSPGCGCGEDYMVEITDNISGCTYVSVVGNVYATWNYTPSHLNFNIPTAALCSNDGPFALKNPTLDGIFTGQGVYNNFFYPDSVSPGIYPVQYTTYDTVSCYGSDTVKYITVDSCVNAIKTLTINNGLKNKFCVGDSMFVDFSYDTTLIPPGTKFYLEVSNGNGFPNQPTIIDSSYSSPIKTVAVLPYPNYNFTQLRYRVFTQSPSIKGSANTDGYITMFSPPVVRKFYTPQNVNTNCGYGINVLHVLANGNSYTWHHDSIQYVDTNMTYRDYYSPFSPYIIQDTSSSFLATANGYYWVEIANEGGCVVTTDSIFITDVTHMVTASVSPLTQYKCPSDTAYITLQTDTLNSVAWWLDTIPLTPADPYIIAASLPGNYNTVVTNTWGCKLNLSATVNQYNLPAVNLSQNKTFVCAGDSTYISFPNNGSYSNMSWYKNGVLQVTNNNNYFYALDSGFYSASYYWGQTCLMFTDTIYLNLKQKPLAILTNDSLYYCSTSTSINIQANCNVTNSTFYGWHLQSGPYQTNTNTLVSTLNINVNPVYSTGVYTLNVNTDCPSGGKDTLWIFPYTMPANVITATDSTSFCIGDSAQLQSLFAGGSNYLWLLNGSDTLSNDTTTALYAYTQGNYTVTVTDSVCKSVSNTVIITTPCVTGIADAPGNDPNAIYIMPNPAYSIISLHIPVSLNNTVFRIYEVSGKLLFTGVAQSAVTNISLRDYRPGMYFLKVDDANLRIVKLKEY